MKLNFYILLILAPIFSFSQQTENYLDLLNKLNLTDSSKIETRFNNDKLKYVGTTSYYEYNGKEYAFLTGKHIRYYKDGSRTEGIYDSWGSILENRYFDKDGNLITYSKTLLIDTKTNDLNEFLNSDKYLTFKIEIKEFTYSPEFSKWYISKESQYTNGKKSGIWKYYLPNGELKKQIKK